MLHYRTFRTETHYTIVHYRTFRTLHYTIVHYLQDGDSWVLAAYEESTGEWLGAH